MERSWKLIPQLLLIACFVFQICASYDDVVGIHLNFTPSFFTFLISLILPAYLFPS
jgi:hypothetical protein